MSVRLLWGFLEQTLGDNTLVCDKLGAVVRL